MCAPDLVVSLLIRRRMLRLHGCLLSTTNEFIEEYELWDFHC